MSLMLVLVRLTDQLPEGPEPADVKAGWTAFAVFLLLIAATVVLAFSLVKHLRRAQAAKDAGVYGEPEQPDGDDAGRPHESRTD